MRIKIKVPRKSQLLKDIWEKLDAAEDPKALFRTFNQYGTVRVRSAATDEYDADLFKAVGEKGSDFGISAQDCVNAFLYEDNLYLDFMVFAADAVSQKTGKTAFVEIFEDDSVPYILIGDGKLDGAINLAFYVDEPLEPASTSTSSSQSSETTKTISGSSSSGTCNAANVGIFISLLAVFAFTRKN